MLASMYMYSLIYCWCYNLALQTTIFNINLYRHKDDLKLYGKTECELQSLVHTVRIISKDISMEFGMDKCSTMCI